MSADALVLDTINEENKQRFQQFLQEPNPSVALDALHHSEAPYRRLVVDIADLRAFDEALAARVLADPNDFLPDFRSALREALLAMEGPGVAEMPESAFHVGFDGNLAGNHTSPRGLGARMLRSLVRVDGIVTKASLVRPKLTKSVHYCPATKRTISKEYRDALTSSSRTLPTGSTYPTKDDDGNLYSTEFGHCVYTDYQTISVQEMPERAPAGQLPRSVEVVLDADLVDLVKPGDRVSVVGVYRALASKTNNTTSGVFRTLIVATNLRKLGKEAGQLRLTDTDIDAIRKVAREEGDVLSLLSRSVAPSIYGHERVKRALLLVLLGGIEKNLPNGTHLRGDLNMLMVGDPSTAKSQLLRFVLHTAPLAVNTTGRGSSGVGLTAAVTQDTDTGERRLEAGAMVLADRGIVCIDEFDKMNDADRVAIHEVMEQQTVTIAKAGIHASLNARCSVVAAANPIFGQYDPKLNAEENVNLPDSLLSRFDFLFVVLDAANEAMDSKISRHVLNMHMYRNVGPDGVTVEREIDDNLGVGAEGDPDEAGGGDTGETTVFQKYDQTLLPGGRGRSSRRSGGRGGSSASDPTVVLTIPFLKKYIHFAKQRIKPKMSLDAEDYIAEQFCGLRGKLEAKTSPVTARTLETLIRVSTAVAKARLSTTIELDDATEAFKLVNYALFNDAEGTDSKRDGAPGRGPRGPGSDSEDDSDESYDGGQGRKGGKRRRGGARGSGSQLTSDDAGGGAGSTPSKRKRKASGATPSRRVRGANQRSNTSSSGDAPMDDNDDDNDDDDDEGDSDGADDDSGDAQKRLGPASDDSQFKGRRVPESTMEVAMAVLHALLNTTKPPKASCTREEFARAFTAEVEDADDELITRVLTKMQMRDQIMFTPTTIFRT